jgi:hypothetical protein
MDRTRIVDPLCFPVAKAGGENHKALPRGTGVLFSCPWTGSQEEAALKQTAEKS